MKKLYRKSAVHPTPSVVSEHLLSFLPAAILALTAALSPGDREVLAYLISCSSASFSSSYRKTAPKAASKGGGGGGDDHSPCFNCNCFRCYKSYWVKWDASPNRQLIHEVIDAFEESLAKESRREKSNNKKERRKGKNARGEIGLGLSETNGSEAVLLAKEDCCYGESNAAEESGGETGSVGDEASSVEEEESEKGSVRRLMSFVGERFWSVWG